MYTHIDRTLLTLYDGPFTLHAHCKCLVFSTLWLNYNTSINDVLLLSIWLLKRVCVGLYLYFIVGCMCLPNPMFVSDWMYVFTYPMSVPDWMYVFTYPMSVPDWMYVFTHPMSVSDWIYVFTHPMSVSDLEFNDIIQRGVYIFHLIIMVILLEWKRTYFPQTTNYSVWTNV